MDAAVSSFFFPGYDSVPRRLLEKSEIGNVLTLDSSNSDTLSSECFLS